MHDTPPTIVGRQSSHLTRVTRLLAHEFNVEIGFRPLLDLLSLDRADYAGHPSLKIPVLEHGERLVFGALNICRYLWRTSGGTSAILWPEQMSTELLDNALEIIGNGMGSEVAIIMSRAANGQHPGDAGQNPYIRKAYASLRGGMGWLETRLEAIQQALHASSRDRRDVSYLAVCLFCFVDHLDWRGVIDLSAYPQLEAFRREFGLRPAALGTAYRFDG